MLGILNADTQEAKVLRLFPSKEFEEIQEADLRQLVTDGVPEGLHIEYKSEIGVDAKEFAKDLSAFANGRGGHLIYGVEEDKKLKVPIGLRSVVSPGDSLEAALSKLHNWTISHIRPVPHFRRRGVRLSDGGFAILLEIPKSWSSPHEVIQDRRCYLRNENGRDPMDIDQLREAFGYSTSAIEQARSFRGQRLAESKLAIQAKFDVVTGPLFLTHLIPLGFGNPSNRISLEKPITGWKSPYSNGVVPRYNLEGIELQYGAPKPRWYVQLNRNGVMEFCHSAGSEQAGAKNISSAYQIGQMAKIVESMKSYAAQWEMPGPFLFASTLINCHGSDLISHTGNFGPEPVGKFDRQDIPFPELYLESLDGDPYQIVRPVADAIWNSVGEERCRDYDSSGNWKVRS